MTALMQVEEIVWHLWVEEGEKPKVEGNRYLIHFLYETMVGDGISDFKDAVTTLNYWDGEFLFEDGDPVPDEDILSWAELPKGWAE